MGWVVLGCGETGQTAVEALASWTSDLIVIDPDRARIEALREVGIEAERSDPTNPMVVSAVDGSADVVLVASDDAAMNRAAVRAANEAVPGARVVAFAFGRESAGDLADLADRVIEYGSTVGAGIGDRILGESGERLRGLTRALREVDDRLGVFMHDNPDPDAIGSAIALRDIAETFGLETDACYYGDIAHQENRALVNLLDLSLQNVDPAEELAYDGYALVDHSRPGVHDQLPVDTAVDIVIDHHPPRGPVEAGFADVRTEAGATSTLLVEYLQLLGVPITEATATGLLYGIRVDTRDFSREVASPDFEAAAFLLPRANVGVLERVENPSVTGDTLDTMARAITNRVHHGSVLATFVGQINDRDALAQAAESLLGMEGVTTTMVYGIADGMVYISARTRGTDLDIGEAIREAFDSIGSAGGHEEMAGAQLSLGILAEVDEEGGSVPEVVADVITNRFFEVIERWPRAQGSGVGPGAVWSDESTG